MEMCRFTGHDDPEFKKVAAAISHITSSVRLEHPTRAKAPTKEGLTKEQQQALLDSLRFDQVDTRWMSIKTAHSKTCKWLLKKSEYLDWLDPKKLTDHQGFLWLKGKPGTGKSTLMKFALAHARRSMKDTTVISFFFNARGVDLEKSTAGMYRSLLLQLLERVPRLQDIFAILGFASWNASSAYAWSIETLKDLFQQAVQSLADCSVACFIDALDECDQAEVRDMVAFFQRLGDLAIPLGIRFRVLFSSRHYPYITISKGLEFVLEGQEGHDQDIADYINSELRIGQTALAGSIRQDLQDKSAGVFMWVVLVVGILNQEHDEGRGPRHLQRTLNTIPADLHALFRDILTRDQRNRHELLLCIQWVLFARRPLKPTELYFAILSGTEPADISAYDQREMPSGTIERFVLNSSKGLAEVTKSKSRTVQFIHESVRDFLLKEKGLSAVWSDLGTSFEGQSHDRLKQCCVNYIVAADITTHLDIADPLPKASSAEGKELRQKVAEIFPFLQYAVEMALWHADTAQAAGICQVNFLRELELAKLISLGNICATYDNRRHQSTPSLLYVLAAQNLPTLIRVHDDNLHAFDVEDQRYGPPIFAALACGSHEAVTAMLEALEQFQEGNCLHAMEWEPNRQDTPNSREFWFSPRTGLTHYLVKRGDQVLLSFALRAGAVKLDWKARPDYSLLLHPAASAGQVTTATLLVDHGADIEVTDGAGRTPLSWAAEDGHEAVVKLLFDHSANIEATDVAGRTPLSLAADMGHEAVVKVLLDHSANIEATDEAGRTPLSLAADVGHEAVVKILLDHSANTEATDATGQTPLSLAAKRGHEAIVKLLLDYGANIEATDWAGQTPLGLAADRGHKAVIKLLLDHGANIEATDGTGRTPLSLAAIRGHEAVVKLLLDHGAIIETRDRWARTPLSLAAEHGNEPVVSLLLGRGAAIEAADTEGRTPLGWATTYGREAVVRLLLDRDAAIETRDMDSRTPLSLAISSRLSSGAVVKLLLDRGAEINTVDKDGRTPLDWAIGAGREAVIKLLRERGATTNRADKDGQTTLS
jgi:ankyrin repeat protein